MERAMLLAPPESRTAPPRNAARDAASDATVDVTLAQEGCCAIAGLMYVDDSGPGITRRLNRDVYAYFDARGKRIRDPKVIARINALVIPPAYTDVWICPDPSGHIQATGRDARGRKQYRYHASWMRCATPTSMSS